MGEKEHQAKRIQTSIIYSAEIKTLLWIAPRLPRWVTSDMLTLVGFLGAVVMAIGYGLSNLNIQWLWLACFGLFLNWFGDSLDGTLARVRGTQRKVYGFYIDHSVDVVNEVLMFIGVGLSPLVNIDIAMFALVGYFMLSIYVFICCHLKGEMPLTFGGLGPTEFRLALIIVNILFIFIPFLSEWKYPVNIFNREYLLGIFDFIALIISILLLIIYFTVFFKDAKYFSKIDP